jgi:hypothetical protein
MRTESDLSAGERFSAFPAHQGNRIVPAPQRHRPVAAGRAKDKKVPSNTRLAAANVILDRGHGKPHQTVDRPSRPREFHPEPLTEPLINLSIFTARATA